MNRKAILLLLCGTLLFSCNSNVKKEYSESGKVISEIPMKEEKPHGLAKFYYETGELKSEISFKEGLREGKGTGYHKNGNLFFEAFYKNGKEDGIYKEYNPDGSLKYEVTFIDGVQEGLAQEYENGKLISKTNYKNGVLDGEAWFFYPNGQLKMYSLSKLDQTIYYIEYDETGSEINEYRVLLPEKEILSINLGETYTVKLKLTGPTEGLQTDAFGGESLVGKEITNMYHLEMPDKNTATYIYKPEKTGQYNWRIWFQIRDNKGSVKNYTYENIFNVVKSGV